MGRRLVCVPWGGGKWPTSKICSWNWRRRRRVVGGCSAVEVKSKMASDRMELTSIKTRLGRSCNADGRE